MNKKDVISECLYNAWIAAKAEASRTKHKPMKSALQKLAKDIHKLWQNLPFSQ